MGQRTLVLALTSWSGVAVFAVGASLVVGTTHHSAREAGRRSPCGTSANVPSVFHMWPLIEIKTRSASCLCSGFLFQICYTRSSSVTGESINQMDGNAHLKGGPSVLKGPDGSNQQSAHHNSVSSSSSFLKFIPLLFYTFFLWWEEKIWDETREMNPSCQHQPHTQPDHFLLFCHNYMSD